MSNYAKRSIEMLSNHKLIGLGDGALDYRRDVREAVEVPEGFIDLSDSLRGGVYILALAGEVVYIGEATGWMLDAIAAKLGPQPRFLPKIRFDQILIRPCHPDQIAALRAELIATYRPRHNSDPRSLVNPISRRAL